MPNVIGLKQRQAELKTQVADALTKHEAGSITAKALSDIVDKAVAEDEQITETLKAYGRAQQLHAGGNPGSDNGQPAGLPNSGRSRMATRKHLMGSPNHLSDEQVKALARAAHQQLPSYSEHVATKALVDKAMGGDGAPPLGLKTASPLTEGSAGSLLPSILQPATDRTFPYRWEPTRIAEYLVAQQGVGQSVEWVQYDSNSGAADTVAEGGTKPQLGMGLTTHTTAYSVIAVIEYVSRQLIGDFGDLRGWIANALTAAVINAENDQLLNGGGTGSDLTGLLTVSGSLSRTHSSTGDDTQIDTLRRAFNDLRTQSNVYTEPDLVICHPDTLTDVQLLKTTFDSYVLSPTDPAAEDGVDSLWGTRIIATTQCPKDNAVVLDTNLAATLFIREGMEVISLGGGMPGQTTETFEKNLWAFRAEERIGLGFPYVKAINVIDGLDTSGTGS